MRANDCPAWQGRVPGTLFNLAPATEHVLPLPVAEDALDALYLGDGHPIGLRCLGTTSTTL